MHILSILSLCAVTTLARANQLESSARLGDPAFWAGAIASVDHDLSPFVMEDGRATLMKRLDTDEVASHLIAAEDWPQYAPVVRAHAERMMGRYGRKHQLRSRLLSIMTRFGFWDDAGAERLTKAFLRNSYGILAPDFIRLVIDRSPGAILILLKATQPGSHEAVSSLTTRAAAYHAGFLDTPLQIYYFLASYAADVTNEKVTSTWTAYRANHIFGTGFEERYRRRANHLLRVTLGDVRVRLRRGDPIIVAAVDRLRRTPLPRERSTAARNLARDRLHRWLQSAVPTVDFIDVGRACELGLDGAVDNIPL